MIYIVVLILLFVLSFHYDINGRQKGRDRWYKIVLIIIILVAGLRWRFAPDSVRYMNAFYSTPYIWNLNIDIFIKSGSPPLWILLNSIIKTLVGKFFVLQLIQAAIVNTLIMKFFKKHSPYPFICVLLYFFWRYQYFNMMILKSATALSILIFANDYFLEKKYKKAFILVLLATGFHQSSILLLITPILIFLKPKLNIMGIMFLISAFLFSVLFQNMLGDYIIIFEDVEGVYNKLNNYSESVQTDDNHGLGYFVLKVFPLMFYSLLSLWYVKKHCRGLSILRFEPYVMIGLMFQVMVFNIYIFNRFVYIYYVYFIMFIVQFFMVLSKKSLKYSSSLSYTRAFIFVLPFLVSIYFAYTPFTNINYNPYTNVIERRIDKERERLYDAGNFPKFDKDQY